MHPRLRDSLDGGKPTADFANIPAMTSRLGSWLRDPLFLLCLTAGLLAFVVQSGELGTADTMHRLQTAHWPIFSGYEDDPAVRSIIVSYSTNILVNVLTALIAFRLLRQLRFTVN